MAISQNADTPLFILGHPRSGTTLIRLILTSHSHIGVPPESEFIVKLFPRYGHIQRFSEEDSVELMTDLSGRVIDLSEQWEIDLEALLPQRYALVGKSYSEVCAHIYQAYQSAKQLSNILIWGDKNNAYHNYIDVLTYLYPKAKFVCVIRDGRAILNSIKQLEYPEGQKYAPRLSRTPRQVALEWSDTISRLDRHLKKYASGKSISIRYEDVLNDFEGQIGAVCDFLGIQYEPEMKEYYANNSALSLEPARYSWKKNTFRSLDTTKGSTWYKLLTKSEVMEFERYAGSKLDYCGYPLSGKEIETKDFLSVKFGAESRLRELLRHARFKLVASRAKGS
jgi:hypothetical protein